MDLAHSQEEKQCVKRRSAQSQSKASHCWLCSLRRTSPSPVIELNRAVAVSMAQGPQAGLTLVDALASEPSLARYHLLPSVRADLLYKLGRHPEARTEFERAAALTRNTRERDLLLTRAASCKTDPTNP